MKIAYVDKAFRAESMDLIEKANTILLDYGAQGYILTLRQLYYQFVSKGFLANTQANYKRLGAIINDARLAGLIDWSSLEDRTRDLSGLPHWDSPGQIIQSAARGYMTDRWASQEFRVEVWIEKEALAGVFQRVCNELDVPFFCCRGYVSQSEMWRAARRLRYYMDQGQKVALLHFGDHDPSGIDMSRDIWERAKMFRTFGIDFRRLALNMNQVEQYDPPPNPAKLTDSRVGSYLVEYGDQSWELDALEPDVLAALVRDEIEGHFLDRDRWDTDTAEVEEERGILDAIVGRWEDVKDFLS